MNNDSKKRLKRFTSFEELKSDEVQVNDNSVVMDMQSEFEMLMDLLKKQLKERKKI